MGASGWVHLDVEEVRRETDKAFLLVLVDGRKVWIPKSQICDPDDYTEGDVNCTVSVTEFIAEQKDLD